MKKIDYSIVVPVRNGTGQVETCIEKLLTLDYPNDRFEILVVDNCSTDGTMELVRSRFPVVRILSEPTPFSCYSARNLGARHASGEWLLFIDADCIADRNILREYGRHTDHSPAVAGAIRFNFASLGNPCEIYDSQRWLQQEKYVAVYHFASTANLLVRRDIFFKAGQFPAGLYSAGDTHFGKQLQQIGVNIHYAPSAIVDHATRKNLNTLTAKAWRAGVGYRQAFERFHDPLYCQDMRSLLIPRFARIWKMRAAAGGRLSLYLQLLWIDWRVNCTIRSAYRQGQPK